LNMSKVFALLAVFISAAVATNEAGTKFLADNAKKEGVVTLPSGLQYKVLRKGSGAFHPLVGTSCECHYEGTLIDGTKFDSSYDRGSPTSFAPNQVIKGWTEAMQLMVEGDKWEMYIPSDLAYGERGSPPKIPGGSALVFKMEIIKINGEKKAAVRCDVDTKEQCDDKEKAFIDKQAAAGEEKRASELKRLQGMNGSSMKPELQAWMARRIIMLTKMVANDGGKKEL